MENNKLTSKYIEESDESFYVTLHSGPVTKKSYTTDFTNTLYKQLYLKGKYEVALSNIYFSNVIDMDLGEIEIHYNKGSYSYAIILKVSGKMGESYESLFQRINEKILVMVKNTEYQRRQQLRNISEIDKSEQRIPNGDSYISLPLEDNPIYDEYVYKEIEAISPKIIYEEDHITFRTTSEFSLKFNGNIVNIIPSLEHHRFSSLSEPIYMQNAYLPNFKTIFLTTDLIEPENCGNSNQIQLLRILNVNDDTRIQSINIDNNNLSFHKVKSNKSDLYHTKIKDINISILSDINQIVRFNQGEVIVRLYFRKIKSLPKYYKK